jgi:hypothetical protein
MMTREKRFIDFFVREAEILMTISTGPFETDKCNFIWRYPVEIATD